MSTAATTAPVQTPPVTVTVTTVPSNGNTMLRIFGSIGVFIGGAALLAIHILLYKINPHYLSVFMCVYMILFTILLTIWLGRWRTAISPKSFEMWMYASVCTMFLEFVVLVFIVAMMVSENSGRGQRSNGRYDRNN